MTRRFSSAEVRAVYDSYPQAPRTKLLTIRDLVLATAKEIDAGPVEETLKWGEPSYLVKGGSTIRLAWKPKEPDVVKVLFNCNTLLVETFRELYPRGMAFEGNRAILLPVSGKLPTKALTHCIHMGLRYHELKRLPLLGN